ncbi:prolyl oligopeptidase family serine peptidase [Plebeiibacterium sediminum]|uniref:prolyl oligopeptidase n=1 Tax=Plebeiibacterium sediminum TaxID=2992112 RepID=A0AAE3M3K4_9BACT|nr:prolyl oligopeptidase family serine peptidase [Plebeiobacterium sediminum]MCW3786547.1 prolyl oligopeptidase family serine peptidase [Plebeiobacterium sediminum]
MNRFCIKSCLFVTVALAACNTSSNMEKLMYPETKKVEITDDYFGTKVSDPYRWLEDDNSEETKQWVIAQNKVTEGYLEKIPYRQAIKNRLTQIWDYEKMSAPVNRSGLLVYSKNDGLQSQNVYYYKKDSGDEKLLLDPNHLSEDGTVSLSGFEISKNGKYLGYLISRSGSDWQEIYVKDIETGEILPDHIEWVKFSGISWFKDGFYYTRYQEPKKGDELKGVNKSPKIYYHKLGDAIDDDVMVFDDPEHPDRITNADVTEDGSYLVLYQTESTSGNSLKLKSLTDPSAGIISIVDDFENDHQILDHDKGEFILKTNYKASKSRIVKFSLEHLHKDSWVDLIRESSDVLVDVSLLGGRIIAQYMQDAHDVVKVYDREGKYLNEVDLPTIGSVGGFGGEKDDVVTYYSFNSFVSPSTVYKYNILENKAELFWKPEIDIDLDQFETKQVFYTSKDGTKVPMFIIHKKNIKLDGNNPTMLYGYGGFDISLTPGFSISRMILLENGGVYAMANLRGGGEYGKDWHKAGTLMQKQNVFDDCIAAAEYLINEKYTSPDKLALHGGSNGGLLVGAVVNLRPDLFKVSMPAVGVMDMLRYHQFTIGRFWASDYGTSGDSEGMFKYLYAYSPVHNVKSGVEYPATMVMTADHDDRVVPAHSFKYISQLQDNYKGDNPVIIRIESKAGHGAGKPTSKIIQEATDLWSFMFYNMGEAIDY